MKTKMSKVMRSTMRSIVIVLAAIIGFSMIACDDSPGSPVTYTVTVTGGTGSGDYAQGETVNIDANEAPAGQEFKNWTTESAGVTFADANSSITSFTMPANAVAVTANFGTIDTRAALIAGSPVNAAYDATSADVTFTGATGLTLSAADFTVSGGSSISNVAVATDTATVTVTLSTNAYNAAQTYTVSINADSTNIKGAASVTITQAANPGGIADTRVELVAGAAVNVAYNATNASVTFTGAGSLTSGDLASTDFSVSGGATIGSVVVSTGTVTVTVNFSANSSEEEAKHYTVGIAGASTTIKGSATVTITQAAVPDTRAELTAGPAVNAAYDATSASVTFTGALGLTLSAADFTVTPHLDITAVNVVANTVTVTVALIENPYNETETYTVHINADSTNIKGAASVTITQAANPGGVADERVELTAPYGAYDASYDATSQWISFESPVNLTLTSADFTVSVGATISGAVEVYSIYESVNYDVSLQITFAENDTYEARHFTIGINSSSTNIKGAAEITITQNGKPQPLTDFTFTPAGNIVLPSLTWQNIGEGNVGATQWANIGTFGSVVGGTPYYSYSLVSGEGDTDNALFEISGNYLNVNSVALTEAREYSVRVQVEGYSDVFPTPDDQKFAKAIKINVGYPAAGTPSAALQSIYPVIIYAVVANSGGDGAIGANTTLQIILSNANLKSVEAGGPATGDDVSGWVNPSVAGLDYTFASYGDTYFEITVSGTPTAQPASSAVTIAIPKEVLLDAHGYSSVTQNLAVSGDVSYDIGKELDNVAQIGSTYYTSLQNALDNAVDGDVIKIINDIELSSTVIVRAFSSREIALQADGANRTIKAAPGFNDTLFNIGSADYTGGTLNIGNGNAASHTPTLIIDGNNNATTIISIYSSSSRGGRVNLYNGVELRNATAYGVFVFNSNRQSAQFDFYMNGGVIAGNTTGVYIYASGDYGYVAYFTMNGGIIYGDDAGENANGTSVYYSGDGAYVKFIGDASSTTSSSAVTITDTLGTAP